MLSLVVIGESISSIVFFEMVEEGGMEALTIQEGRGESWQELENAKSEIDQSWDGEYVHLYVKVRISQEQEHHPFRGGSEREYEEHRNS